MPSFSPQYLAEAGCGQWQVCTPQPVCGFSIDTRKLRPGELFVALKTANRDGHSFLADAKERGAAAALVAQSNPRIALPQLQVADPLDALQRIAARHRRSFPYPVTGITGSCGKTSTKDLLALLLGEARVCRTPANENNHIGVPLSLLRMDPEQHRYAVIEAGASAPGEIDRLARLIEPDAAIITGVAPAHLQGFGSVAAIAREKAALARQCRGSGCVLFPSTCLLYPDFRDLADSAWVVTPADEDVPDDARPCSKTILYRTYPEAGASRIELTIPTIGHYTFTVPVFGPGMLSNTVLAVSLARYFGIAENTLQERLLRWQPDTLRGRVVHWKEKVIYLDCYNASPASLAESLTAFARSVPAALPRLYILGGMDELGDQSAHWHQQALSHLKLRLQDRAFLLGDYSAELAAGLLAAGNRPEQVTQIPSRESAVAVLAAFKGAVLLKASRRYRLEALVDTI